MRILHGPVEVAGQVGLSVFGLREIGYAAAGFFESISRPYSIASDFQFRARSWRVRHAELRVFLALAPLRFDAFHFHYAASFLSEFTALKDFPDARTLRRKQRTVTVEFWGSDIRLPTLERARNPYYIATQQEADSNVERIKRWADITGGHTIAADHAFDVALAGYFPHIYVVGQRIDTKRFAPRAPDPEKRCPVLVHAPSHSETKGTRFVRAAVENLRKRGLAFDYREVMGFPYEEALKIYSDADLIVDQLILGSHGVFAVEAMAMGKPVVSYILPELVETYPRGFPIINANPETIESVLEEWLQRPEERHRLGIQGREYAERVHDCRIVAQRLVEAYEKIAADQR